MSEGSVPPHAPRAPGWLHAATVRGHTSRVRIACRGLRTELDVDVWAPADAAAGTPLPLLVVHDGPAYESESRLTRYCAAMIRSGRLPRHRVALLPAPEREEWYSASARYARALTREIVPALRATAAVAGLPAAAGASLGGLALLHAEHRRPGTFGGLFLQSASFFTTRHDRQESGFARFGRIVRFVSRVRREPAPPGAPPVVLTCGRAEENVHNNRALAQALARQGWTVELHEVPGMHDHGAWRDALDPYLTDLLARIWPPA